MQKHPLHRLALIAFLLLLSCQAFTPSGSVATRLSPSPIPPTTATIPAPHTPVPTQTAVPTIAPLPEPTFTPETVPGFTVRVHPDGGLYVGDRVSFEVIAPPEADLEGARVSVQVNDLEELLLGTAEFGRFGIQGRRQATLYWAWDTNDLSPGEYVLSFTVEPDGPTWNETISLNPSSDIPPPAPQAAWAQVITDCCIIHYITGTEAERDLPKLMDAADQQAEQASQRIGAEFSEPLVVTLLPRVLGHGGFASNEMSVSYLDRNYAGSRFDLVLHHEMIHVLDMRLGGELRPTLLVEGLAVYLTGGHFKLEPLMPRAAAMLHLPGTQDAPTLGWYLPLEPLADEFYASQHETSYLQAAALVEYMVNTWGRSPFFDFYRDIKPHESGSQAQAINEALGRHFGITLAELEVQFLEALRQVEVTDALVDDVRLTVAYYETVRRYQRLLDPSAYFRTAWLLSNEEMRKQGIVADYLRHPDQPENVCLESLLVTASMHLMDGRYEETSRFLDTINASLDQMQEDRAEAKFLILEDTLLTVPSCQAFTSR